MRKVDGFGRVRLGGEYTLRSVVDLLCTRWNQGREGFVIGVGRVSYSYLHMYHATLHHAALMNRNVEGRVIHPGRNGISYRQAFQDLRSEQQYQLRLRCLIPRRSERESYVC